MFKLYSFAWKRFSRKSKILFTLTALTAFLCNLTTVLTPVLQKKLIEQIAILQMDAAQMIFLCAVSVIGIAAMIAESLIANSLVMALKRKLQEQLLGSAVRNKNEIIASKGAGAFLVSIFGDSEQIASLLQANIFNLFFHTIAVVIVFAISLRWSSLFMEIIIPSYIAMILIQYLTNKYYVKYFQLGREKVYEVNPAVLEYVENRMSVRGYANMEEVQNGIYHLFDERDAFFRKAFSVNVLSASLISGVRTAAMMLFFVFSLFRLSEGSMQVSSFVALLSYFSVVFQPISMIKEFYSNSHKFKTVKQKIAEGLKSEEHFAMPENMELSVQNCSFSFGNTNRIIDHISFALDSVIGIVGLSGEGKTTIIKLLLGEISPTEGECVFGKKAVGSISRYVMQTNIRYYGQDIEIFNRDMEFNITLGKIGLEQQTYAEKESQIKELTRACVEKIGQCKGQRINLTEEEKKLIQEIYLLNDAQTEDAAVLQKIAEELAEKMPFAEEMFSRMLMARHYYKKERYEELVRDLNLGYLEGRPLGQRGGHISGGEKNRVALARFLLPEFGKLFILDEPFVNLDVLTENACLSCLKKYCAGMKGIVISHKMNIIRDLAERICVIENGAITADGTHDELLRQDGLYQRLWMEYRTNAAQQQD